MSSLKVGLQLESLDDPDKNGWQICSINKKCCVDFSTIPISFQCHKIKKHTNLTHHALIKVHFINKRYSILENVFFLAYTAHNIK